MGEKRKCKAAIRQVGESKSHMASESRLLTSRMSRWLIERPRKYGGRILHKLNQAFGIWTFEDCQEHDRGGKKKRVLKCLRNKSARLESVRTTLCLISKHCSSRVSYLRDGRWSNSRAWDSLKQSLPLRRWHCGCNIKKVRDRSYNVWYSQEMVQ